MTGVVVGGWEYVIAAYAITFAVLGGYGVSLFLRLRGERGAGDREETR